MRVALAEADLAASIGEVPVGCVHRRCGTASRLATGHNLRETDVIRRLTPRSSPSARPRRARGTWRLEGHTLFVTLEPCAMCAGALVNARIARVVWGCDDPKAGACMTLFKIGQDPRLNHRFAMTRGVLEDRVRRSPQALLRCAPRAGEEVALARAAFLRSSLPRLFNASRDSAESRSAFRST